MAHWPSHSKAGRGVATLLLVGLCVFFYARYRAARSEDETASNSVEAVTAPSGGHAPKASVSAARPVVPALNAADQAKLGTLDQILAARNDNDSRLDRELRALSPALKAALVEKYHGFRPEDRNARGTVVFLLGRELETPGDVGFLSEVLRESPCLSLDDCQKAAPNSTAETTHLQSATATTLAYPQLVALYALEHLHDPSPALAQAAKQAIAAAEESPDAAVARKARALASATAPHGG